MMTTRMTRLVLLVCVALLAGTGCDRPEPAAPADEQGHASAAHDETARAGDWCAEHEIAEAECPFCDPGLIESLGWCGGHDVPEALCYRCNPNLVAAFKAVGDWCAGHDRPESQCYICNPHLAPGAEATAALPGQPDEETDLDVPRVQRRPSVSCTKQNLTVTFARPGIAAEAGLEFAAVRTTPLARTLECNAVLGYDGNRHARIAPQVSGIVASVEKDLGETVAPGDVLATIDSPAFGLAKATYLQADAEVNLWTRNHARETDLQSRGIATERDVLEAETRLAESRIARSRAEQELVGLGLDAAAIARVRETGDTSARYPVTAAFAGVVVDRQAAVGEICDPSRPLFAVADVSRMWARLDVYESDVREIRAGQAAVLHVEGLRGEPVAGEVTWVSAQLDPRTRTLGARVEVDNADGLLRANMFARAVVTVRERRPTLVVPREAVQWEGCCNVVFVQRDDTTYKPRKVLLGLPAGAVYEVLGGLADGEVVVTQGSFLLKTEILKSNIGAGCCEVQPGT